MKIRDKEFNNIVCKNIEIGRIWDDRHDEWEKNTSKMNKIFPLKIVMPGIVTPSQNQIARWLQYEYYRIIQIKKDYWNMLLSCNAHDEIYKAKPKERRRVAFYSYRPKKTDRTNLIAGMKYLEDTLERMGLIWNDSEDYLEAKYYQYVDSKNPRTEIIIYLDNS